MRNYIFLYFYLFIIGFLILLIETSVIAIHLPINLNILFLFIAYFSFYEGSEFSYILGAGLGLLSDIILGTPIGFFVFLYTLMAYLIGLFKNLFFLENFILIVFFSFLTQGIFYLLFIFLTYMFSLSFYKSFIFKDIIISSILAPFTFLFFKLIQYFYVKRLE